MIDALTAEAVAAAFGVVERSAAERLDAAFRPDPVTGRPLPGAEEILGAFAEAGWSPAGIAVWLGEPRGETDGQTPADLLATEPAWVLAGARMAVDPW